MDGIREGGRKHPTLETHQKVDDKMSLAELIDAASSPSSQDDIF